MDKVNEGQDEDVDIMFPFLSVVCEVCELLHVAQVGKGTIKAVVAPMATVLKKLNFGVARVATEARLAADKRDLPGLPLVPGESCAPGRR